MIPKRMAGQKGKEAFKANAATNNSTAVAGNPAKTPKTNRLILSVSSP